MARANAVAIDATPAPDARRGTGSKWLRMARTAICMTVLLLASFAAIAQRTEGDRAAARGVYAAEVEVNRQGAGERNAAFARALSQVLRSEEHTSELQSL